METLRVQIGGMGCAACVTQIEAALLRLPGLGQVRIDPAAAEARLRYDGNATGVDAVLREIRRLGFSASVTGSVQAETERAAERRAALKRLGVATIGMMQVMMFAFALYAAEDYRMDPALVGFLRYCSLFVTLPVVVYAGGPIFRAALSQLRARRPAMDVPVSIGIGAALLASLWNTFAGSGEVYYDAVTMFICFLTASRFVEMGSRHKVGTITEAMAWLLPARALRVSGGRTSPVPVGELRPGDEILVNRGDPVPADGVILAGASAFDESCLSGEALPVARQIGDGVISGSINLGTSVHVRVDATGERTELAGVLRLLERSRQAKPRLLTLADRTARLFSVVILAIAAAVSAFWLLVDPSVALANTVAVLVVACPCALSMAAPAVMACANSALARLGLLAVSDSAIEALPDIRRVVLDKTGTLTAGRPEVQLLDAVPPAEATRLLALAAALERGSSHPLAVAFRSHEDPALVAVAIAETPGEGVEGVVNGQRYRIGRPGFVAAMRAGPLAEGDAIGGDDALALGDGQGTLAHFAVRDNLRPDAREAIDALRALGCEIEIASGDAEPVVAGVARELDIDRWQSRLSPADKLARLRELRAAGQPVLMVGDGINDAPVLAEADVSIVMRSGSALAQTAGDLLLLDSAWSGVPRAIAVGRSARRILAQNLRWAMIYNLSAIPLAAAGYLPPWVAALGMSLSSLLVVLNARRVRA